MDDDAPLQQSEGRGPQARLSMAAPAQRRPVVACCTGLNSYFGTNVDRYCFIVTDLRHLLLIRFEIFSEQLSLPLKTWQPKKTESGVQASETKLA